MEILGIGPSEFIFILIIALIVLGPKDMQKAGRTVGRWLNQLIRSDGWKAVQQTTREIRNLPNTWMREANLEIAETERELRKATDFKSPTSGAFPLAVVQISRRKDFLEPLAQPNSCELPCAIRD